MRARRPGRSRAGRSLIAAHASAVSGDSTNSVRSARTWREAVVDAAQDERSHVGTGGGHGAVDERTILRRGPDFDTLTAAAVLVSLHCSANVRRGTARRHLPLSVLLVRIPPTQCAGL